MTTVLYIDASQPQHSQAGRVLGRMYYSGFLSCILAREEYMGYPHNGGEHSLTLKMKLPDLLAFLGLVTEQFSKEKEGVDEFVNAVLSKAAKVTKAPLLL